MSEHGPEQKQNQIESELKVEEQKFANNMSETSASIKELSNWEHLRKSANEAVQARLDALEEFTKGPGAVLPAVFTFLFAEKMTENIMTGNPEGVILGFGLAAFAIQAMYEHMKNVKKNKQQQ